MAAASEHARLMRAVGILLCGLICSSVGGNGVTATFHVAPDGSDNNPGSATKPFASLERARDAIRERKRRSGLGDGGVIVELGPGVYELSQTWLLEAQDSGTATSPIVYRARPGAKVRLVGGRIVRHWQRVTDEATLQRLDPKARGHVWVADLPAQGVRQFGELKPGRTWAQSEPGLELFYSDQPMTLARWPNEGFVRISEVLGPTPLNVRGRKGCKEGIFKISTDRLRRWTGEPEIMVHGYWFHDWADQRLKVASIDAEHGVITLQPPHHPYGYRAGQWFYAYNLLTELDRPGEWYLDRTNGRLYFWPPGSLEDGRVMVSTLKTLVRMQDVSHVTLRGITFEVGQGTLIEIMGGRSNRVAGCVLRNGGGFAVRAQGEGHTVVGCDIYAMGDGGIVLDGGDRKTLRPAGLIADNNHIHHYSRWNPMYKGGITLRGVGNRATHNLIHHAPHTAIFFGGNDHTIAYNEIYNVCEQSNDAGAIYAGRDWAARGHHIEHNYLHHCYGFEGRGCVGVYLDDNFSSAAIVGNIFYQVPRAAFIGGGRDNLVANNLFIDCRPALHIDARGLGWRAYGREELTRRLKQWPYDRPPWSTKYPGLLTLLDNDPMAPVGNRVERNLCVGGRWDEVEAKARPYVRFRLNITNAPPTAVRQVGGRWFVRDKKLAKSIGFQSIPAAQIGLYASAERASWPVHAEPPRAAPFARKR